MNDENTRKLDTEFPFIFRQRHWSTRQSCLARGYMCGDGWFGLIHALTQHIRLYLTRKRAEAAAQRELYDMLPWWKRLLRTPPKEDAYLSSFAVTQIKEKFGGLRYYVENSDEHINALIALVESLSYNICEVCSSWKESTERCACHHIRRGLWLD